MYCRIIFVRSAQAILFGSNEHNQSLHAPLLVKPTPLPQFPVVENCFTFLRYWRRLHLNRSGSRVWRAGSRSQTTTGSRNEKRCWRTRSEQRRRVVCHCAPEIKLHLDCRQSSRTYRRKTARDHLELDPERARKHFKSLCAPKALWAPCSIIRKKLDVA